MFTYIFYFKFVKNNEWTREKCIVIATILYIHIVVIHTKDQSRPNRDYTESSINCIWNNRPYQYIIYVFIYRFWIPVLDYTFTLLNTVVLESLVYIRTNPQVSPSRLLPKYIPIYNVCIVNSILYIVTICNEITYILGVKTTNDGKSIKEIRDHIIRTSENNFW